MCSPDWYKQLENDLKTNQSSHEAYEKGKHTSLSQSEQEDEYDEEKSTESSSSSVGTSSSRTQNEPDKSSRYFKWNSNKQMRSKLLSVRMLMKSVQHIQNPASETKTLPSSGIITAKSPPPNLELPLIRDSFRRSVTFSSIKRNKDRVS
jgi:hypothetical protein